MKKVSKFIFYKLMGWRISGEFPTLKKYVIIVIPHTSWHDFYIGVLVRSISGLKMNFVAKKELFKPPFGWYFRAVGGASLDRTSGQNKVQGIAKIFEEREEFRLAIAAEGTRKKVDKLKTGFYYVAKEAGVPIVMTALDFANKQVKVSVPFYPTDNKEADFEFIRSFYKGVKGKIPENSFE